MERYDVIIIGGGPAGLTAGIYAARRNLKTLLISETMGGQAAFAPLVENYPGSNPIAGIELMEKMRKQTEKFGCKILVEQVKNMELKGDTKKIGTENETFETRTVIIATGAQHRKLNIEGEDKFLGKGVSYCVACDGPLFKGKKVAIIGGSDSAIKSALYIKDFASETYLIHRRDQFRAEEINQKRLFDSNVKIIWNTVVDRIEGDNLVKSIKIRNVNTGEVKDFPIDGIFIEVGYIPSTGLMENAGLEVNEEKYIKINTKCETNLEGIFAAGDCTGGIAQIISAAGQGAVAATSAYFYIQKKFGEAERKDVTDWGKK